MQEFNFIRAKNLDEALALLDKNRGRAKLAAGGTDLMMALREEKFPSIGLIIDISGLRELSYVREEGDVIKIGGGTLHRELEESEVLHKYAPVLSHAASEVGSPQIRNLGTVAGNIVTAAQCADTVPALIVLEAELELRSAAGGRTVKIDEFFTGPKKTSIAPDEVLAEIRFKKPSPRYKWTFYKLIRRSSVAKARLNFAVLALQDESGMVEDLRISIGSSLPVPGRYPTVEKYFAGKKPAADMIEEAAAMTSAYMIETTGYRWSTEYKKPVVENLTRRCLETVLEVK